MAEYKLSYTASEIDERLGKINEIDSLKTLVGDTSVSEQIAEAISEVVEVYVQDEEPTDALEGSIWVDTSEDGLSGTPERNTANVYVVDAGTTDITTIDFSKYAIGDVVLVTTS